MGALQSQLALGFRKKTSPTWLYHGCFRKIGGVFHPKSSILKGAFHDFHIHFGGCSSFFWKHPYQSYISIGCQRICFFRIWARHQPLTMHALSIWPHKPKTSEDFGAVIFPNLLWQFSICRSKNCKKSNSRLSLSRRGVPQFALSKSQRLTSYGCFIATATADQTAWWQRN